MSTRFESMMKNAMVRHIRFRLTNDGLTPYQINLIIAKILKDGYEYNEEELTLESYVETCDDGSRYTIVPVECTLSVGVVLPHNKCILFDVCGDAEVDYDEDGRVDEDELWDTVLENFYYGANTWQ